MKRMTLFVMALAVVLGLAQCKKDQPTPETQGVTITLDLEDNNDNGAKVNVEPNASTQVTFEDGDQILVASGGHYIGTLTRENGVFAGSVIDPVEGERLYFYFLGNKQGTLETGATACSVNISDQTAELPVISMGKSTKNYSANLTSYSSRLFNKASLMKFNVNTPSEAAICITGMNNVVNVNFGQPDTDNYGFTYSKDDAGLIMMAGQQGSGVKAYWAIVLPQAALPAGIAGSAYSTDNWFGVRPALDAIAMNTFLSSGVNMAVNTTTTNINGGGNMGGWTNDGGDPWGGSGDGGDNNLGGWNDGGNDPWGN